MGYVYLICDPMNECFKIGVTRSLKSNRIKKLQTGNPNEMHIVTIYETQWPFRLEKMLHGRFGAKKVLNEWFQLDTNEVISFENICLEMENIIKSLLDNPFFSKDLR